MRTPLTKRITAAALAALLLALGSVTFLAYHSPDFMVAIASLSALCF